MSKPHDHDLWEVADRFQIDGKLSEAVPYGSGHINDTYRLTFEKSAIETRYILQRINNSVFKNPVAVIENIKRVTAHLAIRLATFPDWERRVLSLVPSIDGEPWYLDRSQHCWRVYKFIAGARSYDSVVSTEQAFQAAKAFGQFQRLLADLPGPRLHNTIPDFHNTPKRFANFKQSLANGIPERFVGASTEIDFALAHEDLASVLLRAGLPERVTHNDTKLSNVLLDDSSGEGICVIDLDTVMPGLALYDFGDMVRTTTTSAMEDERDLSLVTMQFPMFEAILRGYLGATEGFLTQAELYYLVLSCKLIAYEQGIRFLTDYLLGDPYYKIRRESHNLDRCRTQFKLYTSIESQQDQMERLVKSIASAG